ERTGEQHGCCGREPPQWLAKRSRDSGLRLDLCARKRLRENMSGIGIRNRIYYRVRPLIPRPVQVWLRGQLARRTRLSSVETWPILERAALPPAQWQGWPNGRKFAFVLAH